MKDIFEKAKNSFVEELETKGDVWRIFKKSTLADLIKLSFFHFQYDHNEKHLFDLFNYSMKVKLLSRIKSIETKGRFDEFSKKFKKENEFVIEQYETIFNELQPEFNKYNAANLYDLNGKIQYIQVVNNELEIDDYADDIFEEIMGITYTILMDE